MASNLNIDQALLEKAQKVSGLRTKRETVNEALAQYIAHHDRKKVVELFGTIDFDPKYDYKKARRRG
jgi:Arc/MetJ family transcription regulator